MSVMDKINREYKQICRRCINKEYDVELQPSDCIYAFPFPLRCSRCGEQRNIVGDLRISGKVKMILRRKR